MDDEAKGHIAKFREMKPAEINATCLTCHNRGNHAGWEGSTHELRKLSCTTCHSVHSPQSVERQLVKATETQLCATCHRVQVVKTERAVAHMPVREGKMTCSSCHNPHGSISNVKALKVGSSVGELCVSCHAEMRGPVLWEHAPVRENCVTCHDPHGSSNDRMLVVRMPMLCQRCHVATQASRDDLRQQRHHGEQEQPDVRALLRELPLERPRIQPPVWPVLHAVGTRDHAPTPRFGPRWRGRPSRRRPRPRSQPPSPVPPAPAPAQAAPAADESTRSLFEPTWRQFALGGRLSSVEGDPARFQRYEDLRDGLLFTEARYAREAADGGWSFRGGADNVGWRDQRYFADYDRPGLFAVSGLWDSIPQFYSVDTRTPLRDRPGWRARSKRCGAAGDREPTGYAQRVGAACRVFELHERRDIGSVSVEATPGRRVDLTANFTTTRHVGELPWGASFGFGNDVEVALPYDSRTNDFSLGAEWTNTRSMFRVAYNGSWFDNLDDTLLWDSPLRLTDISGGPGRGRMALWPSNSAQTVSAGGYAKFAKRTQLTGFLSYGIWSNDEPLQPFTINSALPQLALPRASAQAEAQVFSTNLNLVSRPAEDWRVSARLRRYDYDNRTPHADIAQFVNYDTSIATSSTGGPEPFAHDRTTFSADATWSGMPQIAVTAGYTHNQGGYAFRIFEETGENAFHLTADAVGSQWLTVRANYEFTDRTGSGLDEALLVEIGEQPKLRHYDIANRTRQRFTGRST